MSTGPPNTKANIRGHKRRRHNQTSDDVISNHSRSQTDVSGISRPSRLQAASPSAGQRRADYLASQSPQRQLIIDRHIYDSGTTRDQAHERARWSDNYFALARDSNTVYHGLSSSDRAIMGRRRRKFQSDEVTLSMWKTLARKVFGYWGIG
ncbi:hypothetical protein L873DRAFT_1787995 [Choiromyces venosus 120613-1]|uniref:Uncharacterized protein n=1 Tax=Choiromyces venosus 120613-1 TaxID=1336337 RepID=A0A3N4JYL8_9PEZI|nr:hypothetical protein L873DRAFT_1787995 [Choiromyces venosus 120613-1]